MVKIRFFFACAVLSAVLCLFLVSRGNPPANPETTVVVAAQDIPAGVFLRPEMILLTRMPYGRVSWKAVQDSKEVVGLTTLVPIAKGAAVLYDQMSPTGGAFGPFCGHSPGNYFLTVNQESGLGKLYAPGADLYSFGKISDRTPEKPIAVFPKVEWLFSSGRFPQASVRSENPVHLYSLSPAQAGGLQKISGRPLSLLINDPIKDEILGFSPAGSH